MCVGCRKVFLTTAGSPRWESRIERVLTQEVKSVFWREVGWEDNAVSFSSMSMRAET